CFSIFVLDFFGQAISGKDTSMFPTKTSMYRKKTNWNRSDCNRIPFFIPISGNYKHNLFY
ncbi:MAG: hypothetical protein WCL70_08390, partial [Paludibacter sp.]